MISRKTRKAKVLTDSDEEDEALPSILGNEEPKKEEDLSKPMIIANVPSDMEQILEKKEKEPKDELVLRLTISPRKRQRADDEKEKIPSLFEQESKEKFSTHSSKEARKTISDALDADAALADAAVPSLLNETSHTQHSAFVAAEMDIKCSGRSEQQMTTKVDSSATSMAVETSSELQEDFDLNFKHNVGELLDVSGKTTNETAAGDSVQETSDNTVIKTAPDEKLKDSITNEDPKNLDNTQKQSNEKQLGAAVSDLADFDFLSNEMPDQQIGGPNFAKAPAEQPLSGSQKSICMAENEKMENGDSCAISSALQVPAEAASLTDSQESGGKQRIPPQTKEVPAGMPESKETPLNSSPKNIVDSEGSQCLTEETGASQAKLCEEIGNDLDLSRAHTGNESVTGPISSMDTTNGKLPRLITQPNKEENTPVHPPSPLGTSVSDSLRDESSKVKEPKGGATTKVTETEPNVPSESLNQGPGFLDEDVLLEEEVTNEDIKVEKATEGGKTTKAGAVGKWVLGGTHSDEDEDEEDEPLPALGSAPSTAKGLEATIRQLCPSDDGGMLSMGEDVEEEDEPLEEQGFQEATGHPSTERAKGIEKAVTSKEQEPGISEVEETTAEPLPAFLMEDLSEEEDEEDEDMPLELALGSPKYIDARERIRVDCWDTEAWLTTLEEAREGRAGISYQDACYQFLGQFPKAGRIWSVLGSRELEAGRHQAVDEILKIALIPCCNLDLWLFYLEKSAQTFLSSNKPINQQNAEKEMQTAYEFAIEHYGYNLDANEIWWRYINFLKSWPQGSPADMGRKTTALRKAYQRAVVLALREGRVFWKDYVNFEEALNSQLAANILPEYLPRHNSALIIEKERASYLNPINKTRLSIPPKNTKEELSQLKHWRSWIEYEKNNPELADATGLRARVRSAYHQCLCCMDRFPEVWFEFAEYEVNNQNLDDAILILKNAVQILPDSLLLSQAFSQLEERRGRIEEAKLILETHVKKHPSTLGFINLERFVRRTEGKLEARKVFSSSKQLRKENKLSYHVYLAHAEIELYINQDHDVCHRVFELGLSSNPEFISEPEYIAAFAKFLAFRGDWPNLRNLYERALATPSGLENRQIWDSFLEFEMLMVLNGGSMESLKALENRRAEAFQEATEDEGLLQIWKESLFSTALPAGSSDKAYYDRARPAVAETKTTPAAKSKSEKKAEPRPAPAARPKKDAQSKKEPNEPEPSPWQRWIQPNSSLPALPAFLHQLFLKINNFALTGNMYNIDEVLDIMKVAPLPSMAAIQEMEHNMNLNAGKRLRQGKPLGDSDSSSDEGTVLIKGYEVPVKQRTDRDIFRTRQRERLKQLGKIN